jgi:hypothetical protein
MTKLAMLGLLRNVENHVFDTWFSTYFPKMSAQKGFFSKTDT